MTEKATEQVHPKAKGLDALPLVEAAMILGEAQAEAAKAAQNAAPEIAEAAKAMAQTIRSGGVLHYAAAGSSGLMAAADAQELGGTFSIPPAQVRIHMAGGLPTGVEMPGDTEDDTSTIAKALADITSIDTLIAVTASGETPYTLAAARCARAAGATVIGMANNPGASLLALADHAITLETPPEVLAGSTRMGAGTAQKIALNMLSTLMAIRLGHVHDGMMVNLHPDNAKLRGRACGIVARIAGVPEDAAARALQAAGNGVKCATLLASGADSAEAAEALLNNTGGHLRPALKTLDQET